MQMLIDADQCQGRPSGRPVLAPMLPEREQANRNAFDENLEGWTRKSTRLTQFDLMPCTVLEPSSSDDVVAADLEFVSRDPIRA